MQRHPLLIVYNGVAFNTCIDGLYNLITSVVYYFLLAYLLFTLSNLINSFFHNYERPQFTQSAISDCILYSQYQYYNCVE